MSTTAQNGVRQELCSKKARATHFHIRAIDVDTIIDEFFYFIQLAPLACLSELSGLRSGKQNKKIQSAPLTFFLKRDAVCGDLALVTPGFGTPMRDRYKLQAGLVVSMVVSADSAKAGEDGNIQGLFLFATLEVFLVCSDGCLSTGLST
jgi:hypothetical protein